MKNVAAFDVGTLVYIALAVIAAIASVMQKKNQQKNETVPESQTDWKDIFEDPESVEEQKEIVVKKNVKEVAQKQSEIDQAFREKSMETYVENEAFLNKSYEYEDVIKKTEIGDVSKESTKQHMEFDLEKAIIYSEIMHRKY